MNENEKTGQENVSEQVFKQENQPNENKKRKPSVKIVVCAAVIFAIVAFLVMQGINFGLNVKDSEQIFAGDPKKVLTQDERRKDTYVVGVSQLPTTSRCYLQTMEGAQVMNDLVYPGLAVQTNGDYHYVLAKSIVFSDNGMTATVKLDTNAYCSDGCQLTADDVIYSLHYLSNSKIKYEQQELLTAIAGMQEYLNRNAETISGIQKVSDTELTISFYAASPNNFAVFTVPVVHPETHEFEPIDSNRMHIGFGEYRIESHNLYKEAILVKNTYSKTSGIYPTIRIVPAALSELKQQEIDTMIIATDDYEQVKDLGSYDIYSEYSTYRDFLVFETNEKQMSNVKSRKKLAEALDRTELVNSVYEYAAVSYGVIAGDKSGTRYESLIKENNSADGLQVALWDSFWGTEGDVITEVKAQLTEAGATVTRPEDYASLVYYYGRVEDLLPTWKLDGFYKDLNGKSLEEAGNLLEKNLVENMYVIPLSNDVYYIVNLCGKEQMNVLNNRY